MTCSKRILLVPFVGLMIIAMGSMAHAVKSPASLGKKPVQCARKILRPNQPPANTKVSFAMPKIHRPEVSVTTYRDNIVWNPISNQHAGTTAGRDPYDITMKGYNEGTKVTLWRQIKSKDIVNPELCFTRQDLPKGKKLSNPQKWLRKQRSREIQRSVAMAEQFEKIDQFTITSSSHLQSQKVTKPEEMPTHSPLKIVAKDVFNRKYATLLLSAQGLPTISAGLTTRNVTIGRAQYAQSGNVQTGGIFVPAYDVKANTNPNNMLITPAYSLNGSENQVKFLGRKAFPMGATVTIVNERLEGEGLPVAQHTFSFVAKKGSGHTIINAIQNDKLRIMVGYQGVANVAQGTSTTFYTRVPKASGKESIKARGIRYYNVGSLPGDPTS